MSNEQTAVYTAIEGAEDICQDRIAIINRSDVSIIIVADGAGGTGDGGAAADFVIESVKADYPNTAGELSNPLVWQYLLTKIDRSLFSTGLGQSTAVIAAVFRENIVGASVGDSQAWLIRENDHKALTASQRRKPLLGDGGATPIAFEHDRGNEHLLVATDGLFNYVTPQHIIEVANSKIPLDVPSALIDAARLKSGNLNDDVAVVFAALFGDSSAPTQY